MSDVVNKVHLADHRPKVSVIIPVYNTEKYLARCLDSVIGQTERDIEIICVNDGSTDGSAAILEKYAAIDPRVKVITQKNKRQGAARNAGLDVALGGYVMFVDSDDVLGKTAIGTFLSAAVATQQPIVANRRTDRLEQTLPSASNTPRIRIHANALGDFVRDRRIFSSVWNKLYRRETIGGIRFAEGVVFEDWPFLVRVFARASGYASFAVPLYFYEKTNASTTRSTFSTFKAECYLRGVSGLLTDFATDKRLPEIRRRLAVAIKMMVSKSVKCGDPEVVRIVTDGMAEIFRQKSLSPRDLDWKTRFRLWRIGNG